MKYLSLFSGIGGFEKGIQDANTGWECVGFAEIDKYAKSIYSYHYPNHTDYDDVSKINVSELPDFDFLVGGFPCQAFSIAGKRQGFKDTRGTLFFEIARICEAKRPEWLLLENVKGLLNHESGKTITTIYEILTELGYSVGWEVVNSCHFGVPQNRERIFIVGHLREAGGRAGEILPFRKNEEPSNKEDESKKRLSQAQLSTTVRDGMGGKADSTFVVNNRGVFEDKDVATCLDANYYKGVDNHGQRTMIKSGTWRTHKDGEGFRELENPDISPCIPARAREDGSGQPVIKAVLTPDRLEKRQNGRRFKDHNEPSFTLTAQDKHRVMIQVPDFLPRPEDINNTLRTGGAATLTAKHNYDHICDGTTIRRLTPIECERLQGFPTGWTKFGIIDGEKTEISDTQRYKTLGNAVTVNVITAIASRILQECK